MKIECRFPFISNNRNFVVIRKMSAIQQAIGDYTSFERVAEFFQSIGIKVKESKQFPNLYLLMYDMQTTDFNNPVSSECRGIILEKDTNRIVCYPFDKFWNHEEKYAATIDWNTVKIQEKLDGSIMKLFFYKGNWELATNGNIDTKEAMYDKPAFYDMFMEAATESKLDYQKLNPEFTYIFELIHSKNIIIIDYKTTAKLVHIGTRCNRTYQEVDIDIGIQKPKVYSFDSMTDIKKVANELPVFQEGFVLCDQQYRRVKVKGVAYVKAHHLKSIVNPIEKCIQLYLDGEHTEVIVYLPKFKQYFDEISPFIEELATTIAKVVNKLLTTTSTRKKYATAAKENLPEYMGILMKMYNDFCNKSVQITPGVVKNYLKNMKSRILVNKYKKVKGV